MDEGLIHLSVLLVFTGLVTFTGWRCWTGRWRFFTRQRTFLNNAWPLGLFTGGALFLVTLAGTLGYLSEEVLVDAASGDVLEAIATVLLLAGFLALLPSFLAVVLTISPDTTYRAKPDGNWATRRLLPRWYQQHLRDRYHGSGPPADGQASPLRPPPPPPSAPPSTPPSARPHRG